jgi:general secretion pathway protein D
LPATRPLPAAGGAANGHTPGSQTNQQRQQSDELLLGARKALSVGDVRRASAMVEQAKSLEVAYGLLDDSPAKVEAVIRKHNDLMQRRAAAPQPEIYNRQYAELLLEQADALVRWQALADAERLATDASRFPVNYGPFETKPDDLLKRIAAAKNGAPSAPAVAAGPNADRYPRTAAPAAAPSPAAKQQALELVAKARAALAAGEVLTAESLAKKAEELHVPDTAFTPQEDRPSLVLLEIQKSRMAGVRTASGAMPIPTSAERGASPGEPRYGANQAIYNPGGDASRNVRAQAETLPPPQPGRPDPARGPAPFGPRPGAAPGAAADAVASQQAVLLKKVTGDIAQTEAAAKKLQTSDPKQSLSMLQQARASLEGATIDPAAKTQMMRRLDREIADVRVYLEENAQMIKLDDRNKAVMDDIERERKTKVEVQEKTALLVNEFNKLMDEHRFAEAEVIAKRAQELAPDEPVVQQLMANAKFVRRFMNSQDIRDAKEQGTYDALASVEVSSTPFDDSNPYQFPDAKKWDALTKIRSRSAAADQSRRRTDKDIEIERKLRTPVSLQFHDAPLAEVMDYLARLAQVNLHLDPQGLAEEGVTSNTPITIDLSQDISLKSALNLILEPLHLSYVIKDEVLKVTSEQLRDQHVYPVTYNVADLVIPIPNFQPSGNMGMAGSLRDAMHSAGSAGIGGATSFAQPPIALASADATSTSQAVLNPALLGQAGGSSMSASAGPNPGGPGGLGGATMADFDSLIELITSTVAPTTWDEVGGPGSIAPFATNLSLVVSQTQEVHDQIADLLEQLRRLQDLQVTIEVRFITLNDNFFERIGIDFDFDVDDDIDKPFQVFGKDIDVSDGNDGDATNINSRDLRDRDHGPGVTVGLDPQGNFSADLDVPFQQGSFPLSTPQFGGFQPGSGATLGFAILSDLEAFFVIEAAQGDRRSNVLQAPKVTLFNGQQAIVSDTSQSPFVISVIPVVGDFAAAQQPVVVVLSEGTFLTVQAVVSSDRRFVRMTVVPFFSQIGEVNTFTFTGSTTSTDNASSDGPDNALTRRQQDRSVTREGTTVQLPTFSFVSVVTTVSVPDGGTVLLGGIKRLSEGRSEFGVPMLNKIPYVSRLFRNVGIGRETQSLMMMVTPRIIIQEEEEQLLGIAPPAP